MIDCQELLSDLQDLLRTVEADLRARSEDAGGSKHFADKNAL